MDSLTVVDPVAPAVTAVVVTHDAGPWFDEMLASLRDQHYERLAVVVVDAGSAIDPTARVHAVLPEAEVRLLDDNPGYGVAVNTVIDADLGAFVALCHDDVRLEPEVIGLLVRESFRSNAGIVGPKLVSWSDPTRLLQVGMSADKTGAAAPIVERGELDQEQHDAVRDVLWIPGAVTLVRTDLLRAVGGFDAEIEYLGEDLDLCWRAQVAGARVVVAPDAVVAHREALGERRPEDDRRKLQTRHRLRTILGCYSLLHLVRVLPQAALLALLEVVFALLAGHVRQARDVASAWGWNAARFGDVIVTRRRLRPLRSVRDREIRQLQVRGSARLSGFLRGQIGGDHRFGSFSGVGRTLATRVRDSGTQRAVLLWLTLLALLAVGSRHLLTQPIPNVGELAALPGSTGDLWAQYTASYREAGLGSEAAAPPALGALAALGWLLGGNLGLARTITVLGPVVVGLWGMWRLLRPTGSRRTRLVGVLAYAAIPVAYNALAAGHWSGLVAYGAAPFLLAGLASASRVVPYGPVGGAPGPGARRHGLAGRTALLGMIVAVASMLAPALLVLLPVVASALAVGSVLAGQPRGALRMVAAGVGGAALGIALLFPWSVESAAAGWDVMVRAREGGFPGPDAGELVRFDTGPVAGGPLGWAFAAMAVLPLFIGRGWRLAWAVRGWIVALSCWGLAFAASADLVPLALPPVEVILAPAAVGLALSTAMGVAAFETDLPGYGFGWRQVAAGASAASLGLAMLPALGSAVVDGRWGLPARDLDATLGFLDDDRAGGAFRVMWLGDADALPLSAWAFDETVSVATTAGFPGVDDLFLVDDEAVEPLRTALRGAVAGDTNRLGSTLTPLGVRYVVVPLRFDLDDDDAVVLTAPVLTALGRQLDLAELEVSGAVRVYENSAWVAQRAQLAADPSGLDAASFVGATPVLSLDLGWAHHAGPVAAGPVWLSDAAEGWELQVGGVRVEDRPVDDLGRVFDVTTAGEGRLLHRADPARRVVVWGMGALWAVVFFALARGGLRSMTESSR